MRLKPVAPLIGLQALRDTVVGDVAIPTGMVIINIMRRDSVSESHLPRAASFEPERWLAEGPAAVGAASARRTSMPFGAGPRICPGRCMALLEMNLAMAVLLGRFDIRCVDTADGKPAREKLKIAMAPVGLRMRLSERRREPFWHPPGAEGNSKAVIRQAPPPKGVICRPTTAPAGIELALPALQRHTLP